MMKYADVDFGTAEAVFNKLGGKEAIRRFLAGELEVKEVVRKFKRDMAMEASWILLEDVPRSELSIANLEIVSFLLGKESSVSGDDMVKRARDLFSANLGQTDAEYILEHEKEIPAEWRPYYLVFPGTVWRDQYGFRQVSYLNWDGERWCLIFYWQRLDWSSNGRLVRPRKSR